MPPSRWFFAVAATRRLTESAIAEEQAMVILDQPEILEPDVEETGAGESPSEDGAPAPERETNDDAGVSSGSGFVPIAVGLAALLPLPALSHRRC